MEQRTEFMQIICASIAGGCDEGGDYIEAMPERDVEWHGSNDPGWRCPFSKYEVLHVGSRLYKSQTKGYRNIRYRDPTTGELSEHYLYVS